MLKNTPILLLVWFSFISVGLSGQNDCGTEITKAEYEYLSHDREARNNYIPSRYKTFESVPIKAHVVRQSDGRGGVSPELLIYALQDLNKAFSNSGIHFTYVGDIDYIDSDTYYKFSKQEEEALASGHDRNDAINVYFLNSITNNSGIPICGYSYMPGGKNRLFLSASCLGNGTTFAHEMGHYLSLYHTHGVSFNPPELADESNCSLAGDELCDTPADPNLLGKVEGCEYTGKDLDVEGNPYHPDVENIMSYATPSCRVHFSQGQINRMLFSLQHDRAFLAFSDTASSFADQLAPGPVTLEVYPNPSQGQINIRVKEEIFSDAYIAIYNVFGKLVDQQLLPQLPAGGSIPLDLSRYGKGIYVVYLKNGSTTAMQKVIYQ